MRQQNHKPYFGLFITLEGGEGCGKTTLSSALAESLEKRGYSVIKTREPGGSHIAEEIRNLLLHSQKEIADKTELLLFLAARSENVEKVIKPALRAGKIVICERFNDSTIAYQGCARSLGMDYVEELCQLVTEGPDVTLLLDMDPEEGILRMKGQGRSPDRIEQEKLQFHKEVRQGFLHLADSYPERIKILDAAKEAKDLLQSALQVLEPYLMTKHASSS